jgi:hypothetical protein
MKGRLALVAAALAACTFAPDLSRFPPCGEDGSCPAGSTCLMAERLCVRDCEGEGDCSAPAEDGGADAGMDGGADAGMDAGVDAGPPLVLVEAPLDAGVEARPYSHQFTAEGGRPPYSFTAAQLPAGFSISDGGLLAAANAGAAGSHDLQVEVRDDAGNQDSRSFPLQIRPLLRMAGPPILARGFQGVAYSGTVSATGGTPRPPQPQTYTFGLDGGDTLPGLQLGPQGELTGTPTQSGTFQFGVVVSDGQGQVSARQLQLTVDLLATFVGITTEALPDARANWPYSYRLRKNGGGANVTWSVTGGSFPPGIGLDTSTGEISGTTVVPGLYNVTVRVTDGGLFNATASFPLKVESD